MLGLGLGWWLYGNKSPQPEEPDALEKAAPPVWGWLRDRLYVDEFYGVTVIAFYAWWARVADWLDRRVWGGVVAAVTAALRAVGAVRSLLRHAIGLTAAFDKGCEELSYGGGLLARVQTGRVQTYLRLLALAVVVLAAILIWSSRSGMNGIPILTLLTVLPVVGAVDCALVRQACARRGDDYGAGCRWRWRWWCGCGSACERKHRPGGAAPLGALAGHRVSPWRGWAGRADAGALGDRDADVASTRRIACIRQPGLYFALVLLLEAGLFGTFTALNFFHWFLYLGTEPDSGVLPDQAVGRSEARTGGDAVLRLHDGRIGGPAAGVPGGVSFHRQHGLHPPRPAGLDRRTGAGGDAASASGRVMMWLAIGVLAGFAVKVPLMPFHTWLPAAYAKRLRR